MGETSNGLRSYVYLRIHGFETHHQVTQHLGLEPTQAWNLGDPYMEGKVPRLQTRACGRWSVGDQRFSPVDENEQLDALIACLLPYQARLQTTPPSWMKSLVIVHETDSCNADMLITVAEVAFAAAISADFQLDVYSLPLESTP